MASPLATIVDLVRNLDYGDELRCHAIQDNADHRCRTSFRTRVKEAEARRNSFLKAKLLDEVLDPTDTIYLAQRFLCGPHRTRNKHLHPLVNALESADFNYGLQRGKGCAHDVSPSSSSRFIELVDFSTARRLLDDRHQFWCIANDRKTEPCNSKITRYKLAKARRILSTMRGEDHFEEDSENEEIDSSFLDGDDVEQDESYEDEPLNKLPNLIGCLLCQNHFHWFWLDLYHSQWRTTICSDTLTELGLDDDSESDHSSTEEEEENTWLGSESVVSDEESLDDDEVPSGVLSPFSVQSPRLSTPSLSQDSPARPSHSSKQASPAPRKSRSSPKSLEQDLVESFSALGINTGAAEKNKHAKPVQLGFPDVKQDNTSLVLPDKTMRQLESSLCHLLRKELAPKKTRSVYIMQSTCRPGLVKIGMTKRKSPGKRVREIKYRCKLEHLEVLHFLTGVENATRVERLAQCHLKPFKEPFQCIGHEDREWFRCSPAVAREVVDAWVVWMERRPYKHYLLKDHWKAKVEGIKSNENSCQEETFRQLLKRHIRWTQQV
ncbi:meiotically up-regulated protein [Diplodia corticola]|uniref:Meiotically up-regulated protein n=1 Tax=Diplodia corticola TaxID=236234 RepID=A0A1J9QW07_9PEZI|nr:meiotically up-regulated protein [Diplodia corticola]OJD32600.1 meiotically up-regulated protein [Diplodia corticola]